MSFLKKLQILVSILFLTFVLNSKADQQNPTLLTVGPVGASQKTFDFAQLSAMKSIQFETKTIWTEGVQRFEGLSLKALLTDLNITKGTVWATAVNDYAIEIPISELAESAPIIAYKQNGSRMSLRDKGPLWLVYPYDSDVTFQTEVTYSRSIWQLNRIEIK